MSAITKFIDIKLDIISELRSILTEADGWEYNNKKRRKLKNTFSSNRTITYEIVKVYDKNICDVCPYFARTDGTSMFDKVYTIYTKEFTPKQIYTDPYPYL